MERFRLLDVAVSTQVHGGGHCDEAVDVGCGCRPADRLRSVGAAFQYPSIAAQRRTGSPAPPDVTSCHRDDRRRKRDTHDRVISRDDVLKRLLPCAPERYRV